MGSPDSPERPKKKKKRRKKDPQPRQIDTQKSLGGAEFPETPVGSDDPTKAYPDEDFEDRPGLKERRERPKPKRGDSDGIPENVPLSFIGRVNTVFIITERFESLHDLPSHVKYWSHNKQ